MKLQFQFHLCHHLMHPLCYMSHQESLKLMVDSDVLLVIIATEESYNEKIGPLMIPGKVFEYLGAKRPMLALVPSGATADLIRSTKRGIIAPPNDINSIRKAIFEMFQEWERGNLGSMRIDVSKYGRKRLTEKLAKVFNIFCGKRE